MEVWLQPQAKPYRYIALIWHALLGVLNSLANL
jgi:hypothetical protein